MGIEDVGGREEVVGIDVGGREEGVWIEDVGGREEGVWIEDVGGRGEGGCVCKLCLSWGSCVCVGSEHR